MKIKQLIVVLVLAVHGQASASEYGAIAKFGKGMFGIGFEAGAECRKLASMADSEEQQGVDLEACQQEVIEEIAKAIEEAITEAQ